MLTIKLLGTFNAHHEVNSPVKLNKQGEWLLTLLVLQHDREIPRADLAKQIYPPDDYANPLQNFKTLLFEVRKALGDGVGWLPNAAKTFRIDIASVDVDLIDFRAAVRNGSIESLERAVELYRGPLLDGCEEIWIHDNRRECQEQCRTALEHLADHAGYDYVSAERYLRKAVAVEPDREATQCGLMRVLADNKNFGGVDNAYLALRLYLHEKHNRAPEQYTTNLYHTIQQQARREPVGHPNPTAPPPNNIPAPFTSFVGRENQLLLIKTALSRARLVTLKGEWGIGKSRLAEEVAREVINDYPDGVWLVELAGLENPELVTSAVSNVLRVKEQSGSSLEEGVLEYLKPKTMLLVLDNCEHLLPNCAHLVDSLMRDCKNLKILTTSRTLLGCRGENVYDVPPLSAPSSIHGAINQEDLTSFSQEYEAVRLFIERVQTYEHFVLTSYNAPRIAQICYQFGGNPLLIELAASRMRLLSVDDVAAHSEDPLTILTIDNLLNEDRPRVSSRQRNLRNSLEWSYNLLIDSEKLLFAILSVFAGGWTLAAAQAVGSDESAVGVRIERDNVQGLLMRLLNHSLIYKTRNVDQIGKEQVRFHLLETTIRPYAAEKLAELNKTRTVWERHYAHFLALAKSAQLEVLEFEQSNFRVALDRSLGAERLGNALPLTRAMCRLWQTWGRYSDGLKYCTRALEKADDHAATEDRAVVLKYAGIFAFYQGHFFASLDYYSKSLEIWGRMGEEQEVAAIYSNMGLVYDKQNEFAKSLDAYKKSLAIRLIKDDQEGIATCYLNLGNLYQEQGMFDEARSSYNNCLPIWAEHKEGMSYLNDSRGKLALRQGNLTDAQVMLNYSLDFWKKENLKYQWQIAVTLNNLGILALKQAKPIEAIDNIKESLTIQEALTDQAGVADSLEICADLLANQKRMEPAAQILGAAEALRTKIGSHLLRIDQASHNRIVVVVCSAMNGKAFEAAQLKGRTMNVDQSVRYAQKEAQVLRDMLIRSEPDFEIA